MAQLLISILASHHTAQGSILCPRIFLLMLLRFIDGTAYNSGQRLDNVNQPRLVLTSGKQVLQKKIDVASGSGSILKASQYHCHSF